MRTYTLTIEGRTFTIAVKEFSQEKATLEVDGNTYTVRIDDVVSDTGPRLRPAPKRKPAPSGPKRMSSGPAQPASGAPGSVTAPIPGLVLEIFVREGQEVSSGEPVLKMEAMKMETVVNAPSDGTVQSIAVNTGDSVTQGQQLMTIG